MTEVGWPHLRLGWCHCNTGRRPETEVVHQEGGLSEGALPPHGAHQLPAVPVHQDGGLHLGVQEAVQEANHQALGKKKCICRL